MSCVGTGISYPQVGLAATAVEAHHWPPVQAEPVNAAVLQTKSWTVEPGSGSEAVADQVTV